MKTLLTFALFIVGTAWAQTGYTFDIFINDQPVPWALTESFLMDSESFVVPEDYEGLGVTVGFNGGYLKLNLADWGTWDYAHVLGVDVQRTGTDTYTFSTTVRHRDEGWEHYANVWRVRGENVTNGVRELLHPHDEEQPFTRSQSNVKATGTVTVEASDNVHGASGSTVTLDLSAFSGEEMSLRYKLIKRE